MKKIRESERPPAPVVRHCLPAGLLNHKQTKANQLAQANADRHTQKQKLRAAIDPESFHSPDSPELEAKLRAVQGERPLKDILGDLFP